MLFGYPIEATEENWLHDCLAEVVQTIHTSLQKKQTPPRWPDILPAAHRAKFNPRNGLKNRLTSYQKALETLNDNEQNQVIRALNQQNAIESLLSSDSDCETVEDLPESIRQPVKDLFTFAFEKLTEFGVRDRQYQIVCDKIPHRVCPFCGCEFFDSPTGRSKEPPTGSREDLDHYLARSKYPFASVNLHNLVPMCHKCNSDYKGTQDLLYSDDGKRRKAYYPYNCDGVQISLKNSKPLAGRYKSFPVPLWQIDFEPDVEETSTWNTVFQIRKRYEGHHLDPDFRSWLDEFSSWYHSPRRSANKAPISDDDMVDAIKRYSEWTEAMGMMDRAFLRAAVFRMLLHHCEQHDRTLIRYMRRTLTDSRQVKT
jgi:hypothetical protein